MPQRQSAINIVHGLPDDQRVVASIDRTGQYFITRSGTPSFLDQIGEERRFTDVWLGPGAPERMRFAPHPTINYIADADLCQKALQAALTLSQSVSMPWFNHPRSVLNNTREKVALLLQDIPGVIVPRTIRLAATAARGIVEAIDAHHIGFPAIIRIAGHHGGTSIVLIDAPEDVQKLDSIPWGGKDLYISEFVNCRSPDGKYRKHRIAVVGGQPVLRHIIIGTDWLLNFNKRLLDPESLEEEQNALASPLEHLSERLPEQIREIDRRLALDYFGMDCSVRTDGTLVVFEANPTMHLLHNSFPSPNIWDGPIARCKAALLTLLDHPERWLSASDHTADRQISM